MQDVFIFFTLLAFIACQSTPKHLSEYSELQNVFTPSEIEELNIILEYFDKEVCLMMGMDTFYGLSCYDRFFNEINTWNKAGSWDLPYFLQDSGGLTNKLSSSTFKEIWITGYSIIPGQDSIDSYVLNPEGKYALFLEEMAKTSEVFKNYSDQFSLIKTMSPSMFANVALHCREFDITDEQIRFFLAVHFLTVSEQLRVTNLTRRQSELSETNIY